MTNPAVADGGRWDARRRTSFPPDFTDGKLTFADYLNLFLFSDKYNVRALIRALQSHGFSKASPGRI